MRIKFVLTMCCFVVLNLSACSLTKPSVRNPQFYPNEYYKKVGAGQAHSDTRYCMSLADDYVKDPEAWKDIAKETGGGAVLGAATGAVGGAIFSKAGRGTAAGAATGAIIGLVRSISKAGEPNPNYERFVEQCLADKGYRVYQWD